MNSYLVIDRTVLRAFLKRLGSQIAALEAETDRLRLEIEKLTDDKAELQRRLQRRDPSTGRYAGKPA